MKRIVLWAILWASLALAFYYQDQTFAFEAVEREVVSDALYTLAEHTDFLDVLHECTIERSYFHISEGEPESDYFKLPWLYAVTDQECSWGSRSMYVDVLNSFPKFERLDKVPLYPSMS